MVFMLLLTPGILSLLVHICSAKYDPTWDSLDKRPIPKWYDEAKIGMYEKFRILLLIINLEIFT